jgi:hypothetical protein
MMPLALFRSSDFVGLSYPTLLLYGALGGVVRSGAVRVDSGGTGFSAPPAGAALAAYSH